VVGVGLLAGLFGLGRPPGGQLQLPRGIRRTGSAELGEPVPFGAQLPGGQPPHIHHVENFGGQGLAAVAGQDPGQQLLRRPRLLGRMGPFVVGAKEFGADGQVQVGAVLASGELHIAALHVLGPVQGQQRPLFGAALGAHVGPGIGQIDTA
jgi:hypothetical protein